MESTGEARLDYAHGDVKRPGTVPRRRHVITVPFSNRKPLTPSPQGERGELIRVPLPSSVSRWTEDPRRRATGEGVIQRPMQWLFPDDS